MGMILAGVDYEEGTECKIPIMGMILIEKWCCRHYMCKFPYNGDDSDRNSNGVTY